jgi:hypothetical protein
MNPLFCTVRSVRRMAMALVAMASLIAAVGCGSSSNGGAGMNLGFSKASLNGHYVFAHTGIGVNQAGTSADPFSETIVFTADGNGNLNVTVDDFDQDNTSFFLASSIAGTYAINRDGTGLLSFNGSNFPITMIDDSHFYDIEQDIFATASGFGEKQDTSAFGTVPSGTFVFKAHNLGTSSRVGSLTVTSGNISGLEDFLTLGSALPPGSPTAITGSFTTAPDGNGRGQFTLSDGTSFAYYVVNSSKFHFLDFSNAGATLEIGLAEKQTGGPFSNATLAANASYVFGSSGDTTANTVAIHSAGVFTSDGNANITAGTLDFVQDGTVNGMVSVQPGSTYSVSADGRGVLNLTLSNGLNNQKVFWMVSPTRAYLLVNTSGAIEDGTFSQQQGAPFSNSSWSNQSAFFMDGFDLAFKDRVGVINPNNGSFGWIQQAESFDVIQGGLGSGLSTTGTYQVSANGRVVVTVNGLLNPGNSNMVFYLISNSSGFMVQEDQGFDIGGAFSQQTGP